MVLRVLLLLGMASCLAASTAAADGIANGSFETPVLSLREARLFSPGQVLGSDWIVVGNPGTSVLLIETTYGEPFNDVSQFEAADGLNSVDLSGPANVGPSAGVQQTIAVTSGQSYLLSFSVGRVTPNAGPGGVYPSPATVDLSIDGAPRLHFTNADVINGRIAWRRFSTVVTPTGPTTTLTFLNGNPAANNEAGLDAVSLEPVPEPNGLALLGSGACALGALAARRTRRPNSRSAVVS